MPVQSEVHKGGPGGSLRGGDAPLPCHTLSASPPSLCATQSGWGVGGVVDGLDSHIVNQLVLMLIVRHGKQSSETSR